MRSTPHIEGFTIRPFEDSDAEPLQALFDADPEFFQDVNGRDIPVAEIRAAIPPGRAPADKFFFALDKEGRIAGLLDIIRGYPEPTTWYLGFIFLAKHVRGVGVGRRALHAIYEWTRGQGAATIRLGVVEGNTRARWRYASEGFVFKGVREIGPSVNRARRTLVLERAL